MKRTINTNVVENRSIKLSLDDVEIGCQIINLKFKPAGRPSGKTTQVGCPEMIVAEPGEWQDGSLTGEIFADLKSAGITRLLLKAYDEAAIIDFELTYHDDTANPVTFTGTAQTKAPELPFDKPGNAKQSLDLEIKTSTLAPPAAFKTVPKRASTAGGGIPDRQTDDAQN